jgi:PucR C-terminal helix-turn-helix domain/GGDEF-like domain
MSEIQALIDALAERLKQPVGVDDRHFRAVAYSSHPDQIDEVRIASILHRAAPAGVTDWLESIGVSEAQAPVRVPANADFAMASRICVPLRFRGTLLGYLWLLDEPHRLPDAELEELVGYAEALAVSLYRLRRLDTEQREHQLVTRLLEGQSGEEADSSLEELFVRAPLYGVAALRATSSGGAPASEVVRALMADAADRLRREMDPGHLLVDLAPDQALCILACGGSEEFERRLQGLQAAASHHLGALPGWSPLIGAGEPVSELRHLPRAGRRAREALRIAGAIGLAGPVVRWENLGAYRTVVALLGTREAEHFVPWCLLRLLADADADRLIATLECYLDHGGDARAAADELFIHRSSLYGRLRRIEEAAGVDLGSGEQRLELHLGLRLLRLAGSPALASRPALPR